MPKALVLEPDNILWDGVLSEKGVQGINLAKGDSGEAYLDFQRFLLELKRTGIIFVLCSKYPEYAIRDAFARQEMLLTERDFAAQRFNVTNQGAILPAIAEDLHVNQRHLTVISRTGNNSGTNMQVLPDVNYVILSEEPAEWEYQLSLSGVLDQLPPRGANISETSTEQDDFDRGQDNLNTFFDKLNLIVDFKPVKIRDADHLSHLTHTVTECNLTGEIRPELEIAALIKNESFECWGIRVSDRFGDYGMAGAVFWNVDGDKLIVDSFLLNCRILGRHVEFIVLEQLGDIAKERSCTILCFKYEKTNRNELAINIISKVTSDPIIEDKGIISISPDKLLNRLAEIKSNNKIIKSEETYRDSAPGTKTMAALVLLDRRWNIRPASERTGLLKEMTEDFRNVRKIVSTVENVKRHIRPDIKVPYVKPRTEVENKLAEMWSRMLGVEKVGAFDDFFHLGGHSILATQLILELSQTFDIALPVRIFFATPTVATMAQSIEALQGKRDSDELDQTAISSYNYLAREYFFDEIRQELSFLPDQNVPSGDYINPSSIFITG
ncbi:FkbH like protein, partial [Candidatus Thiomargarita nelsonii]